MKLFNIYSDLRMKEKNHIREKAYLDIIIESLATMFKYSCDIDKEDNLNRWLEIYLRTWGTLAFYIEDDVIKFGRPTTTNANQNEYGDLWHDGEKIRIVTERRFKPYVYRTIGKDCVIIRNNKQGRPEINLQRYVTQLSEVDISQWDLLQNARQHPIIVTKTSKMQRIIEKALKDRKVGVPVSIADTDGLATTLLAGGNDKNIDVINLTDPQNAELFQYYSHYHMDLTQRLYGLYGMSQMNTGKMAQTNNLEVSGTLASSMIIPYNNYQCRKFALDEVKRVLGVEVKIEWGECIKHNIEMLQNLNVTDDATPQDSERVK